MNSRSRYKTKQKETLLKYLETIPGTHVTAGDVCGYLKEQGMTIGQSTVYRQMESLVDEGILNKYIIDGTSPACFEYVSPDTHGDTETCFHCKCEKCGKLIHLHCEELEMIQGHLLEHHQFLVNPLRTVFYGVCEDCRKA